jgi:branched-chain amino acid transport system permease protein
MAAPSSPPAQRRADRDRRAIVIFVAAVLLLVLPPLAQATGQPFLVNLFTRIVIYAIAAVSLDLILGFGGMVSFGHAAWFGLGGYVVAIAAFHGADGSSFLGIPGSNDAVIVWPAAIAITALVALPIGALSLRTSGVHFIMITLAFAQMIFYLAVSLKGLGGDDGLALEGRPIGENALYYAAAVLGIAVAYGLRRVVDSRFGRALQGIRENEARMEAVGYPVLRIKLAAFALAGGVAGLAGAALVTLNGRVGPSLLDWPQSGQLLVMVILGGVGRRFGGFVGAAAVLLLEEVLAPYWAHWPLALGVLLLAVVLRAPRGIAGLFARG